MTKSSYPNLTAVVLAGGKGTRMQSETPKVLHHIGQRPMVFYTLQKLLKLGIRDLKVVIGHKSQEVKSIIEENFNCGFVFQTEQLGTGHALGCALKEINTNTKDILVVNGDDSAFYKEGTLQSFINFHKSSDAVVSMLTLEIETESKLGRVIRDKDGNFEKILEANEYFNSPYKSNEINCGAYIFNYDWVKINITHIPISEKGEYYITELLNIAKQQDQKINLFKLQDSNEWVGINTQEELRNANLVFERVNTGSR
ncbi:MAG: Bifunctional protein GlmU [Candidatus Daviesbacteria bacterium GW2011_GWA2_38_24]|uniref:Bifunctional protein GlmU n=1 Tax=Candidatus Daviesbacteria bacterium GW2011_GWA2_38_24 TaxID=1618422 RepID=A0A0G0MNC2_9BACT|nr:MAG: Bifunctional protein GlmU [Candidatus Daviesbacteria bacterium GW2011_GWA2_38_24]KKQ79504.1 MAG: Bifunctional protein GlmU [Candidatus Daviesbacteria bacterium GW2011_GWA1_38_7]OGE24380.1 MAG: hypothetical protein A2688_01980 [Candidatus Daviesbacteria bacterium RIFCSPHIGHO2_01_FULL_38_8]